MHVHCIADIIKGDRKGFEWKNHSLFLVLINFIATASCCKWWFWWQTSLKVSSSFYISSNRSSWLKWLIRWKYNIYLGLCNLPDEVFSLCDSSMYFSFPSLCFSTGFSSDITAWGFPKAITEMVLSKLQAKDALIRWTRGLLTAEIR